MPDFHRGDDWWRHGREFYLDNLEATGLYQVPLSSAHRAMLCRLPDWKSESCRHLLW